jgi:hypothetical protein
MGGGKGRSKGGSMGGGRCGDMDGGKGGGMGETTVDGIRCCEGGGS